MQSKAMNLTFWLRLTYGLLLGALISLFPATSIAAEKSAEKSTDKTAAKTAAKDTKKGEASAAPETAPAPVPDAFSCTTDIFYAWRRTPPPAPEGAEAKKAKAKKAKPAEIAQPDDAFHSRLEAVGPTEAEAKVKLRAQFAEGQSLARQDCEALHQDQAGCLAKGLRSARSEYQVFDYGLRKSFVDALDADCQLTAGVCLSTRAAEANCVSRAPQAEPALADAEPGNSVAGGNSVAADEKSEKKKEAKK